MNEKIRAHIFVQGMVQGVFFRVKTRQKAKVLGVTGWVKNLPDDRVEAVFEGEKEKVEQIIEWIKKGPLFSRVDDVKVDFEEYKGEFESFEIRY